MNCRCYFGVCRSFYSCEPSDRTCADIWRLPQGSNTPSLCSVAGLIPVACRGGIWSCKLAEKVAYLIDIQGGVADSKNELQKYREPLKKKQHVVL